MASNRTELTALKKLLSEVDLMLAKTDLPENRTALALTDDLLSQAKLPAAAILTWERTSFVFIFPLPLLS